MEDSNKKGPVTPGELRLAGIDLLARREHGSSELKTKLAKRFRKRGCDPDTVEQVTQQLIEEGLLSDERFAASRVRQLAGRGYGPRRIRNDLRQQRVEHLVSDTMGDAFDSEVDWEAEAAAVYKKNIVVRPLRATGGRVSASAAGGSDSCSIAALARRSVKNSSGKMIRVTNPQKMWSKR